MGGALCEPLEVGVERKWRLKQVSSSRGGMRLGIRFGGEKEE